jgi:hypothetical protein
MTSQFEPASTLMEFLTWIACWGVFMLLQRRLCRRYPGLRTVCRVLFLWTLVVVLVPGVWTLVFRSVHGPRLLSAFNHAFGLGVFAQTSLRSLVLVRWLAWPGTPPPVSEPYVIASLVALSEVMQGLRDGDAPEALAAEPAHPQR